MEIVIRNHIARAVFSADSTVSIIDRGFDLLIELGRKGNIVAAQYRSREGAVLLISLLTTAYNFVLSPTDKASLLNTQF